MTNAKTVKTMRVNGQLYETLADNSLKPLAGKSDWNKLDAMSDAQVEAEALNDQDNPPLSDEAWAHVKLTDPFKTPITIRLDNDVLNWFKSNTKRGYQTQINAVLRRYVEAQEKRG